MYEAIYCVTPMIVIPQIPEQLFYGRQIDSLMLGKCIESKDLTVPLLRSTVVELLENDRYRRNLQALKDTLPKVSPAVTACNHIEELVFKTETVGERS